MGLLDQNNYAGYAQEGQRLAVEPMSFTPMDAARFVAEATPIIGDAMAAKEVYDELQKPNPNYAMVAALGGAALVGLVPGLGDAMAAGIKKGARGLLDTAKRIEVDPSIVGSMGGNLKVRRDIPNEMRDNQVLVRIPVKDVEHGESAMFGGKLTLPGSRKLIEEYSQKDTKIPPIEIMSYEDGLAMIADGSHRFEAAKLRGQDYIEAYVNKDDFLDLPSAEVIQPSLSLPAPRNEAEAMAKKVLEMRASGNARDVTEKMMAAADDQYMFKNTPIPMDVSSRMARADEMNPRKGFHGTNADIKGFEGNVFSTDNPTLASTYARGISDGQIYPLRLGSKFGDTIVEGAGADWHKMNISDIKDPAVQDWLDWAEGQKISTREIENAARKEGRSGVQFKNIKDTGPGINSSQFKNIGYTKEQERDLQRQYMKDLSNPSNVDVRLSPNLVRSQFARFDPEFKHLKNLTAAGLLAPGVLAAMQEYKKQQELERGLLSY